MVDVNATEASILRVMRNWYIDCSGYTVCDICPKKGRDDCDGRNDTKCPINSLKDKIGK